MVDAALESLAARGLRGATSRDIARRAGTNLQAITYHFGSKDDLVAAALAEAVRGWVAPAVGILRSERDPVPKMIAAVQALQDAFERGRPLLGVYIEALVLASRNESLRASLLETIAELRGILAGQIGGLRAAGFLPAWIDADAMAMLLLATADGLALHASLDPAGVDHHGVSAQAMQMLLAASSAGGPPADHPERGRA